MRFYRVGLGLVAAAAALSTASAQTTPPAKETVTVTAKRPAVQVLPDRTVYSLDKSIQSSTGSLSDALRTLPSVNVDIDGNVSLRGDSNVTILVDGKQSPLLAGDRASALQQIPANMVDRIEVITNPSSEFRAEGSAGIINIVLKKEVEMAASGVVRVNVGDKGRANISASGNVKLGRVNLNGGYGERRDASKYASITARSDGMTAVSSQEMAGKNVYAGRYTWLAATVDLNSRDQIELGSNYNRFSGRSTTQEHNIVVTDSSDVTRDGLARWQREAVGAQAQYSHKFAAKGEQFELDVSRYTMWTRNSSDYTSLVNATGLADYWQSRGSIGREAHTELKADYTLPLPEHGRFKIGYALQNDATLADNHGTWRDATMAAPANDSTFTNCFLLDRTVHAGYISYERKFGRFGVMAGLRLEQDFLTTNLKTTGEVHDTDTLGVYPSLHLSYSLTDTQQLKLSYSRRMNRPGTSALNPARFSSDAFNVRSGNPFLKPEQIDSVETSYHWIGEKLDAMVTGYYRATYKGITSIYRTLPDAVLLTTTDNLARRMDSGVEANLDATLFSGLTLRTNGTLAYNEFNPGAQGIGNKTSGMTWNLRAGVDWQVTPTDFVQLNANYWSKRRYAQATFDPGCSGDFGYKHTFDGGFAAVASINNLFNSWGHHSVLDAPGLHQVKRGYSPGRMLYVGLVYTFGGFKDTQAIAGNGGGSEGGTPGGP